VKERTSHIIAADDSESRSPRTIFRRKSHDFKPAGDLAAAESRGETRLTEWYEFQAGGLRDFFVSGRLKAILMGA
jgi:hypothetical protein